MKMKKITSQIDTAGVGGSTLVVVLLIALMLCQCNAKSLFAASAPPPIKFEVAADAPDSSVELVGYLYIPPDLYRKVTPPLVVVLHQMGESHMAWKKFWESLYAQGIATFAIDLRGHGMSIYDLKQKRNRPLNTFYADDFLKYPDDIKYLVDTCIARYGDRLNTSQIAVVGASIGANAGLLYALSEPRVKYLAMISPGIDYKGLNIAQAMKDIKGVDIFLATADQDMYSYVCVELLTDLFKNKVDYEVYQTFYHGNRLFSSDPDLFQRVLLDIVRRLRPDIQLLN